jgi:NitT/TauT family transport system permease protein
MVMPIVYASTMTGMSSADKSLLEVAEIYNFSGIKRLRLLYLPSAVPFFLSGAKTSLGLAWKSAVAAEVLCNLKLSIGGAIYSSKNYLETTELFAWTLCVITLSLVLEKLIYATTSSVYKKYTVGEVSENAASN